MPQPDTHSASNALHRCNSTDECSAAALAAARPIPIHSPVASTPNRSLLAHACPVRTWCAWAAAGADWRAAALSSGEAPPSPPPLQPPQTLASPTACQHPPHHCSTPALLTTCTSALSLPSPLCLTPTRPTLPSRPPAGAARNLQELRHAPLHKAPIGGHALGSCCCCCLGGVLPSLRRPASRHRQAM